MSLISPSRIFPATLVAWTAWLVWFLSFGTTTEMSGLLLIPGALPWIFVVGALAQVITGAPIPFLDKYGRAEPGALLLIPCYLFNVYLLYRFGRWWEARIS